MHLNNNELIVSQENRDTSPIEIIDNFLWFEGYSKFKTSWCMLFLAGIFLQPHYNEIEVNMDSIYQSALYAWDLHHLPHMENGIPVPLPPALYQMEEAARYFIHKRVVVSKLTAATKTKEEFLSEAAINKIRLLNGAHSISPQYNNNIPVQYTKPLTTKSLLGKIIKLIQGR
jgi:hypothetical protein